jgi:hypothetical protein
MKSVIDHRDFPAREFIIKQPHGETNSKAHTEQLDYETVIRQFYYLEHLKFSYVNSVAVHIHIGCKLKHRISIH